MQDASTSTIAQLLFSEPPRMNFAVMVGELDAALGRCQARQRSLVWDCEDVAVFDVDGARIVLGHVEHPGNNHAACLTASVGPAPGSAGSSPLLRRSEALCHKIVDRIQARYPADSVLWHTLEGALTAERLDDLLDRLPHSDPGAPLAQIVNLLPLIPEPAPLPDEAHQIRAALYPEGPPWRPVEIGLRPSAPMRLAIHAMNASLICAALPVGAALMTHALLRGEDLRLTARVAALTGAALAFTQSGLGGLVLHLI